MPTILALDIGRSKIGAAVGSTEAGLARPLSVWRSTTRENNVRQIRRLAEEQGATLLLVGCPLNADGSLSKQATHIRRYVEAMSNELGMPVEYWNEAFSTQEAQREMLQSNRGQRDRRQMEDAVAAAIFLQEYLDAQRKKRENPPAQQC